MTTRPSEPKSRRHLTRDLVLRRPAADRPTLARPPLIADPGRKATLPASLFLGLGEPLPSDYYLG